MRRELAAHVNGRAGGSYRLGFRIGTRPPFYGQCAKGCRPGRASVSTFGGGSYCAKRLVSAVMPPNSSSFYWQLSGLRQVSGFNELGASFGSRPFQSLGWVARKADVRVGAGGRAFKGLVFLRSNLV